MTTPLRLGLIGCGGIVQRSHAPAYLAMGSAVEVRALADVDEGSCQACGSLLNVPRDRHYSDYRDMLGSADLDAVTIATPHNLHAAQAVAAAEAGLAIISEKPMAPTAAEADAVLDAVERAGVPYGVIHNFGYTPGMRHALEVLSRGEMGQTRYGRAKSIGQKSEDQVDPEHVWRASKAAGGGAIRDTAYHEIYLVEALVGSPVRWVEARVQTLFYDIDVDDLALLLLEHESGAVSTVSTSWGAPGAGAGETGTLCEVHGLDGSLRVVNRGRGLHRYQRTDRQWEEVDLGPEEEPTSGHGAYFAAALTALASGQPPPVTGSEARHNLEIIEAACRATQERRAVEVTR